MFPASPCSRRFCGAFAGLISGALAFGSEPVPFGVRLAGGTGGFFDIVLLRGAAASPAPFNVARLPSVPGRGGLGRAIVPSAWVRQRGTLSSSPGACLA